MNTGRSVALVAITLIAPVAVSMHAMIRSLPLPELVKRSEFIMAAQVTTVTGVGESSGMGGLAIVNLRNELRPVETSKGAWPTDKPIVLATIKPKKGWLEDNVELPPAGSHVLLFLGTGPDGKLGPVNGIQGVWPMDGEKLLGMGFGKTLADIRTWVDREPATRLFSEGRELHDKGDAKGALDKYKESLRIWPDEVLRGNLMMIEQRMTGQLTNSGAVDDIPCEQADPAGQEVPPDFAISTGSGPAHTDWGGYSGTEVNARGEVIGIEDVRKDRYGIPERKRTVVRTVPRQAIDRIYAQVVACGFFDLPPQFRDPHIMDGGVSGLTVTAAGRTHSVTVANMSVTRVFSITRVLEQETQPRQ